jgi:hypothetical protein
MAHAAEPMWYAIRTAPGSQKPQREYIVEPTACRKDGRPVGKGYRITPSLDPRWSAIEKSLGDAGYTFYMPAEKRLVRDRRHTDLWKTRRFALMVGYVFVRGPFVRDRLLEVPGVIGIVANADGFPLAMHTSEILKVRAAEAAADVAFDDQTRAARRTLRKNAKKDPRLQKLVDRLDIAGTISMPLDSDALAA